MARDKFWFGFIVALSLSAWLSPLLAAQTSEIEARTLIVVAPKTTSNLAVPDLMSALRSQLEELDITVVLSTETFAADPTETSSRDGRDVLAFVWLVEQDGTLTVHFYEAAGASLRERRIPVSGTDAVNLEEVAIIVRSAVSALLERAEKERQAEPQAPPDEGPEEPTLESDQDVEEHSDDPRSPLGLGFGLTLSRYAPQTSFQQGLRGFITLGPPQGWWEISAGYTYIPAASIEDQGVSFSLARHPIEVLFAADYTMPATPLFVGGSWGVILDPIVRRTTATPGGTVAEADETRTSWATTLHLRAGVRATPLVRFFVEGGAELLLRSHDQVIGGEETRTVVSPYRIRPHVFAGISLNLP